MDDEEAFLAALWENLHDDVPRLVYADWLQERGDLRHEYLRVQVELARTWTYTDQRPDLYERMAKLQAEIDPAWLALVRRCTTPAAPVNVEELIPELKGRARTAVRPHPRQGEGPPGVSKIGSKFLWPADEPWPTDEDGEPFVTAIQLRKQDVPELGFPPGKDLFQVLWDHDDPDIGGSSLRIIWRDATSVTEVLEEQPPPPDSGWLVPEPCLLYPERVIEYPHSDELTDVDYDESPEFLRAYEKFAALLGKQGPDDEYSFYVQWLSICDATKVGGYPEWISGAKYPACPNCGIRMSLLLQCSSREPSWGDRWTPIEDRRLISIPDAEWGFGDSGILHFFICRSCGEDSIVTDIQSS